MFYRIIFSSLLLCLSATASSNDANDQDYQQWARGIWQSLDRQTGEIVISDANATLNVPDSFYYLNPEDSKTVLEQVWGNPPGQQVLGMLFPAEYTPFDSDSWAVSIQYEEDGYVSDSDAEDIDYVELLQEMQADTKADNQQRIEQGYESIQLVGWAASPYYDASHHKLHWAKELKFGDQEVHTLNYNIRILGRKGVLVLNFIANMDQLATISANLDSVLALANFDQGSSYLDFNPDIDQVAAYGLGALVAGKVIAKTGFFVVALLFLKKFAVIIVVGLGALLKGLFRRKKAD
ncbi:MULTISPECIES: DUF2167 domain-containing protein [unclassified Agarivorans]|uniref:DUF2167 domain-containing protein n=1 Tax=unclassified Agarivorans TaxID=2636026 RepID=UPI003D7EDD22